MSQLLIGSCVLAPFAWAAEMPTVDARLAVLVLVSAMGSAIGNFLLVLANRRAEASLIAPLVYTQLISATVLGVLVFGDWPDALALVGLAVIAASGIGSLAANRALRGPETGRS
jgi:drug/metabolite transporter (DMT)-like permease